MNEKAINLIEKMKSNNKTSIHLNIWDDLYEDDYVPEGQKQETHAYIEDSFFSDDEKELLMMCFHGYLVETFKEELEGVKVIDGGYEIYFKDITHKKLDSIMRKLDSIELTFGGIPYNIYSES